MVKRKLLVLVIMVALVSSFFIGCELDQVTKEQRIDMFMDDLNSSDRAGIQDNFVSGTSATATGFTPEFGSPGTYTWSWSGGTGSGTFTGGLASISGTFTWQDMGTPLTGESWKILKLQCAGPYFNEEPAVGE